MAGESGNTAIKSTRIFGDYLFMLMFPAVMSFWYYGFIALRTLAVCVITSIICDLAASMIMHRQYFALDYSATVSGIMIALMLPANAPVYVGALASMFAVLVIKIPFGGGMRAPFVPAAAGFASAAVCFKDQVFTYTDGRAYMTTASIASTLNAGSSMRITGASFIDVLTGNIYGPMGTGCVIVFIGCIVFLAIRRREALTATAGFLAAVAVSAIIFPRTSGPALFFNRSFEMIYSSLVLEIASGSLLFAAVFLLTDYSTLPKNKLNKFVYGAFTGILCMVMRHLGAYEEPVCFAVLLGNAASPMLDILSDRLQEALSSKKNKREVAEIEA